MCNSKRKYQQMKKAAGNPMWGKMPCVVDTLKCFLHALAEICLIWEQCSQKWLKPLCSPSVCNPRAALPRGRTARLYRGLQQGSGVQSPESLPSGAGACGALGGLPHPAVGWEIPPVVLGSSMCPLAEAVSLCFASDSSSD